MAKVAFSKLKCKINENVVPVQIGEETIAVKQYLPIQDKLKLIGDVVMASHEQDYNYSNPVKVDMYRDLEIVFAYTNLTFTDKQKEDITKLYDMLVSSGVMNSIIDAIPEEEYVSLCVGIVDSIESIYKYQIYLYNFLRNNLRERFLCLKEKPYTPTSACPSRPVPNRCTICSRNAALWQI